MVVPWSEIPARKWAKVGKPIAAHEFCKRLYYLANAIMADLMPFFLPRHPFTPMRLLKMAEVHG